MDLSGDVTLDRIVGHKREVIVAELSKRGLAKSGATKRVLGERLLAHINGSSSGVVSSDCVAVSSKKRPAPGELSSSKALKKAKLDPKSNGDAAGCERRTCTEG